VIGRAAAAAVNNAGAAHGVDRVGDIQDKDIDTMFATNVFGLISLTQLLVKGLSVSLALVPLPPTAPFSFSLLLGVLRDVTENKTPSR
jgi:NAD(P)-dependent dehydrogenase (short-subunit alcohol dehydrogenase family)